MLSKKCLTQKSTCYMPWTKCLCPPPHLPLIYLLEPNPQCDDIWKWGP